MVMIVTVITVRSMYVRGLALLGEDGVGLFCELFALVHAISSLAVMIVSS
jgi:hypothetical protein